MSKSTEVTLKGGVILHLRGEWFPEEVPDGDDPDFDVLRVTAHVKGEAAGRATFALSRRSGASSRKLVPLDSAFEGALFVEEAWRRRGVASAMYDFAERYASLPIKPSRQQSRDGTLFWAKRRR